MNARGTLEARGIPGPSRGTCFRYIWCFQRTLVFHEVLSKVKLISNGLLSKVGGSPDLPEDLVHARGTLEARTGGVTKCSLGHKASATGWQSARPLEMKGRWVGCDSDVNADFNRGDGQGGNIGCCWPRTFCLRVQYTQCHAACGMRQIVLSARTCLATFQKHMAATGTG